MTMNDPQLSTKMWANLKNILFSEKPTPPSELHSVQLHVHEVKRKQTLYNLELRIVVLWLGRTHGRILGVDNAVFLNPGQVTLWVLIKLYT